MKYIIATLFLSLNFSLMAQPTPVKWEVSYDQEALKVIFSADIEAGWVIYSQNTTKNGPVPTKFTFEDNSDFSLVGGVEETSKVSKKFDRLFEMDVLTLDGQARFEQEIKLENQTTIKGYVTFMTCDGDKCLPPTDVPFELKT